MPTHVVVEGKVDHAIVRALAPDLDTPEPKEPLGREAAIQRAALATKEVGGPRVALMLDRNGHTQEFIEEEVRSSFQQILGGTITRRGPWYIPQQGAIRIVLAGLPEDALLSSLGINRFTSDDYLLKLLLTDDSLRSFCQGERHLSYIPTDCQTLREILLELAQVLRIRELTIESSKTYVLLVRAVLGFDASRARLAQHLIERCPEQVRSAVLGSLRGELLNDPTL